MLKRRINAILLGVVTAAVTLIYPPVYHTHPVFDQTGSDVEVPGAAIAAESELKAGTVDPETGKKIKYWVAPMDPTYIREEPGKSPMGMDLVPVYEEEGEEKESTSTIRIDPVTVQNMGVRIGEVDRKSLTKYIRTVGNITYNEKNIFTVNTKFNGWIEKIYVDFVGEAVEKGQPLFDIYSPDLVTTQEEYLLALRQYVQLRDSNYADARQSAQRLLDASRKRLEYWDMTYGQIRRLEKTRKPQKTVTVYSPASGIVTGKEAFDGHYVVKGQHQYTIADLSTVWVDVDIYEYELPWVEKGMTAEMTLSYIPGEKFTGKIVFIYPYLETETRTAKGRLEFSNKDHELKPGMFADISIKSTISKNTLVIPQEAVIDSGIRKIVFVALGNGRFQPREVKLGVEGNNDEYQVLDGLAENEQIVLSAQFMLDSESRLREAIQKMIDAKQKKRPANNTAEEQQKGRQEDALDTEDMDMNN